MSEPQGEFAELLAAAGRGDESALVRLVQIYEPKVRLVARVRLGPALRPYLDETDLVQSVHKSLLVGLRQNRFDLSDPEKLVALAVLMVRRKVARRWRHLRRQQRLSGEAPDSSPLAEVLTSLGSPEADPARAAEYRDQVEHLCRRLDATERQMLDLRLQGFSWDEIAPQLGLNAVTLRVRMTRLRQRLHADGVLTDWL